MPIDVDDCFRQGGRGLIDFLEFCVISVRMEPVFAFLVQEYRERPTAVAALELYDMFCTPQAPARLSVYEALPPRNIRLRDAVEQLRARSLQARQSPSRVDDPEQFVPPPFPEKYLFDSVTGYLDAHRAALIETLGNAFDPELAPHENLPGGKMTAPQRAFVDRVWQPVVRRRLVAAGFRRISNIA